MTSVKLGIFDMQKQLVVLVFEMFLWWSQVMYDCIIGIFSNSLRINL